MSSTFARPQSVLRHTRAVTKKECSVCGEPPLVAEHLCVHFGGELGNFPDKLIVCYRCVGARPGVRWRPTDCRAIQLREIATPFRPEVKLRMKKVFLLAPDGGS